jgi:hypothetical protein
LHPFDLATNKVLTAVGRHEVRDWVDLLLCHQKLQPLPYLIYAAVGKDPGWQPSMVLEQLAATHRYRQAELNELSFSGSPPVAAELMQSWRRALSLAEQILQILPPEHLGTCVLTEAQTLLQVSDPSGLSALLPTLRFHSGRLYGAWPSFVHGK